MAGKVRRCSRKDRGVLASPFARAAAGPARARSRGRASSAYNSFIWSRSVSSPPSPAWPGSSRGRVPALQPSWTSGWTAYGHHVEPGTGPVAARARPAVDRVAGPAIDCRRRPWIGRRVAPPHRSIAAPSRSPSRMRSGPPSTRDSFASLEATYANAGAARPRDLAGLTSYARRYWLIDPVFPPASVALLGRRWSVVELRGRARRGRVGGRGEGGRPGEPVDASRRRLSLTIRCRPR